MNKSEKLNKLDSLILLLACALLVIWLAGCAQDACADVEPVWVPLLGTDALEVHSLHSDGERLYGGTRSGLYISDDDGSTWRPTALDEPYDTLTIHRDTLYATAFSNGVFRSDDRGETWKPINNGLPLRFWDDGDSYYPSFRQIFVTSSGTVILVSSSHLYTSTDRGDTWRDVTQEWLRDNKTSVASLLIESMGEFGGYLWALYSGILALRSPDEGATWETIPDWVHGRTIGQFGWAEVWITFRGELYVAEGRGFGRWREEGLEWENLSHGLPEVPGLRSGVVHRDRIYAGSWRHDGVLRGDSVFMFDHHAETWYPAGLSDRSIHPDGLVSHRGSLYANVTSHGHQGVYRAKRPIVSPEGKAAVTWGAIKLEK